jgi:hypothetical protein
MVIAFFWGIPRILQSSGVFQGYLNLLGYSKDTSIFWGIPKILLGLR